MNTDRELLELAAKAAGIYLEWDGNPAQWQPIYYEGKTYHSWNPLTDDGDALALAVDLKIEIHHFSNGCNADMRNSVAGDLGYTEENAARNDGDIHAAVRRAIVRAAAAIGEAMP